MRNAKFILPLLLVFAAIGNVWGADWSYSFSENVTAGSKTLNSKAWTVTINGGTTSTYSSDQGAHYGTNNNTCNSVTFETSAFTETITSVSVEASRGSSLVGTLSISVNGSAYTLTAGNAALTTTNATNTFTGTSSGNLVISWTKSSGKGAFYIKSINVVTGGSKYTLYLYDASNGTVGVSGKSGTAESYGKSYSDLASGTKLTLTNTPASGYRFDGWTVMDEESNDLSSCLDGNQITMPAKDVHVYSSFSSVSACNTKPTLGTIATAGSSTPSTVTLQWPNGITSKGEEECEITSYGFVYGTGDNPALDGSGNAVSGYTKVEVGTSTPTLNQQISHIVTGLQSGTQVNFRFYATNAAGTTVSSTKGSAVTSSLQDHFFDNVQESDGYTDAGHTEYNAYTVPSLSDKTPTTEGSCEQVHYHFVGWVSEANKSNPTDSNIIPAGGSTRATGTNYYAVWAKEE